MILALDGNQDVYNGQLATTLSLNGINMGCQFETALGEKGHNSDFLGMGQITTIPGLEQGNVMCYSHWYGIGDH